MFTMFTMWANELEDDAMGDMEIHSKPTTITFNIDIQNKNIIHEIITSYICKKKKQRIARRITGEKFSITNLGTTH